MTQSYTGGCQCGKVRYQVALDLSAHDQGRVDPVSVHLVEQ